jgi:uncharacterized iron-regulated membrane protein
LGTTKSILNTWTRKLHRWGAILIAAPLLLVICTGLLLLLKKHLPWVQPPMQRGQSQTPAISFDQLLARASTVPEAQIRSWKDIDRLDVRPANGIVKVHAKNHWELQIDTATGDVLQMQYRRSDLIESLHDGSWFHSSAKLWVFLPSGVVLLALWVTGVYLWWLPVAGRRASRRRRSALHRIDSEPLPSRANTSAPRSVRTPPPVNGRAGAPDPGAIHSDQAGERRR